ncbi:type II toxin-antitoxin system prevent-host-death family antitoxin [Pseudanabaena minima]|uniref:type II toxin-antitoxin system prevent-host-death family antitoxin n=1 Tax=Pseudanabaena minima TaxID=890415 RepID=UPI003DAA4B31
MVNILQIGQVGSELSQLVHDVQDRNDRIVIESDGKPVVAMVRYEYLTGLLEALEDALDSKLLRQAIADNDAFFGFEDVLADHNQIYGSQLQVENLKDL